VDPFWPGSAKTLTSLARRHYKWREKPCLWLGFRAPVLVKTVEKLATAMIDIRRASGHYYLHKFAREFILGPGGSMVKFLKNIYRDDQGQDIAEYAVMLAVILVLVIGTVRLIGGNANNVFSQVGSTMQ
jgi:Flp pilus assembly pilin Flp